MKLITASLLLAASSAFQMVVTPYGAQASEYYGNLYIGSSKQLMTVVWDTGKQDCWLPMATCDAAECTNGNLFDSTVSTTYGVGSTEDTQTYHGLTASGTWVNDQFCLRSTSRCTANTFSFLGASTTEGY